MRTNADGTIIDAGRRTRTIPPATRRALEARDRGCRFPDHSPAASGARGLRFTDGHHIVHWADGGATALKNLVLLCARHHRRVHEGGYRVCSGANGKIVFFTRQGRALYDGARPAELPADPVKELVRGNRERGVVPDEWAAAPRWHRDCDVPWEVEAAAREALDPWEEDVGAQEVLHARGKEDAGTDARAGSNAATAPGPDPSRVEARSVPTPSSYRGN